MLGTQPALGLLRWTVHLVHSQMGEAQQDSQDLRRALNPTWLLRRPPERSYISVGSWRLNKLCSDEERQPLSIILMQTQCGSDSIKH